MNQFNPCLTGLTDYPFVQQLLIACERAESRGNLHGRIFCHKIGRMQYSIDQLSLYLHLARLAGKRRQMSDRNRFLVLAAVQAARGQLTEIAAYCRHLILETNPGHMFRRWDAVSDALDDEDFQHLFKQVSRRFPIEKSESILNQAGIDRSNERATYYSDAEYAASIMGVEFEWLKDNFGSETLGS